MVSQASVTRDRDDDEMPRDLREVRIKRSGSNSSSGKSTPCASPRITERLASGKLLHRLALSSREEPPFTQGFGPQATPDSLEPDVEVPSSATASQVNLAFWYPQHHWWSNGRQELRESGEAGGLYVAIAALGLFLLVLVLAGASAPHGNRRLGMRSRHHSYQSAGLGDLRHASGQYAAHSRSRAPPTAATGMDYDITLDGDGEGIDDGSGRKDGVQLGSLTQAQHEQSGDRTRTSGSTSTQRGTADYAADEMAAGEHANKDSWVATKRPYVIAHRGASGELPEHTLEGYRRAIELGADFVECDVVFTRDLVPICRHEPNLNATTTAFASFASRMSTVDIDGVETTGIFAWDLTYEEVSTLRAVQPWPFRAQTHNGMYSIPTLRKYLQTIQAAPRVVGIYPELKHPADHARQLHAELAAAGTTVEDLLLVALTEAGYGKGPLNSAAWRSAPVYVQCFEVASLRYMASSSCIPLMLLLVDKALESDQLPAADASGDNLYPATGTLPISDLSDAQLADVADFVAAVGPAKTQLVTWDAARGSYHSTGLSNRLHAQGLQVHVYTLRDELQFLLPHTADSLSEVRMLRRIANIDAAFSDFPSHLLRHLEMSQGLFNSALVNKASGACKCSGALCM